jgi:hypothetical protein
MVTLQEFINDKYKTAVEKEAVTELNFSEVCYGLNGKLDGGKLDLKGFKNVKRLFITPDVVVNSPISEKHITPFLKYLDSPVTGLDVSGLGKLEELNCSHNEISELTINGLTNLKVLICRDNDLQDIKFLDSVASPEKLEILDLNENDIAKSKDSDDSAEIKVFAKFKNLTRLFIGTSEKALKEEGKRNNFSGSLKDLKDMTKLEMLDISATDINEGLEYLPESLINLIEEEKEGYRANIFRCFSFGVDKYTCQILYNQLFDYKWSIKKWRLDNPDKVVATSKEIEKQRKWQRLKKRKNEATKV